MNIKTYENYRMISSTYLYLIFTVLVMCTLLYLFFSNKTNKNNLNNKILLKNLLEGFDLELPEELKRLDNSATDSRELY